MWGERGGQGADVRRKRGTGADVGRERGTRSGCGEREGDRSGCGEREGDMSGCGERVGQERMWKERGTRSGCWWGGEMKRVGGGRGAGGGTEGVEGREMGKRSGGRGAVYQIRRINRNHKPFSNHLAGSFGGTGEAERSWQVLISPSVHRKAYFQAGSLPVSRPLHFFQKPTIHRTTRFGGKTTGCGAKLFSNGTLLFPEAECHPR